jgi:extracellular matrix regulatory protein B
MGRKGVGLMFLHVGADVVVSLKRVVGILDMRSISASDATRDFLSLARSEKRVTDISGGDAKSVVLTDSEVYLSPISSLTLMKRADFLGSNVVTDLGTPSA